MKDGTRKTIFFGIIILIGISILTAIIVRLSNNPLNHLTSVEIQQYKGKDLSSVTDFVENSIKGPQQIDIKTYKLKIDGLVETPADFTYEQILSNKKYTKVVTLDCVEGWSVDILWEGVLLKDLFDKVKIQDSANTVIFHSFDGFTTSLPLKTILDKKMVMAYKANGIVLPPELGFPFQIVAEEKLGYKWAKWVTRIEISDNSDYRGYWESRGYSNEANVNN